MSEHGIASRGTPGHAATAEPGDEMDAIRSGNEGRRRRDIPLERPVIDEATGDLTLCSALARTAEISGRLPARG